MSATESHKSVENFQEYPEASYADVALARLAAFTIKQFQDLHIPTTFENITVALFKQFPKSFCMVGFGQYPDAANVGRTLMQLGPKYRNWARGSVQKGFVLTESGIATAAEVVAKLEAGGTALRKTPQRPTRPRTMDISKDIDALEKSSLYRRWKRNALDAGEPIELYDLLNAFA